MFVLTLLLALPAFLQNTNVTVQPDMRLFTTMVALNAAGFDVEFASEYHPVRQVVRKYAAEVDAGLLTRLRDFYSSHKGQETDNAQLVKYISLAVSVTDAPALKKVSREEFLTPDASTVLGFTDFVRVIYVMSNI